MADSGIPRQDRTRIVLATVAALVGLVWLLQGLGAPIGRSFMIGDPVWVILGGALLAGSGAYAAWQVRRRPSAAPRPGDARHDRPSAYPVRAPEDRIDGRPAPRP